MSEVARPSISPGLQNIFSTWWPATVGFTARYGTPLAFFALLLSPVFAVDIPAMVDYPNHLARMYLLSRDGTAAANNFYEVTWALYPNLAMDLIVPWLAHFMSVETATRAFYLLSQVLTVSGAIMLERVVKGRLEIAPFTAAMFLYSLPVSWGFVNFQFGLGVALWAIVGWLVARNWPQALRIAVHCTFVLILFVAHFFALGIYGAVIGLHELWRTQSGRATIRQTAITFALLAAPVIVLLITMFHLGGSIGGTLTEWGFIRKFRAFFHAMSGYSLWLSVAGMLFVTITSTLLARRKWLRFRESGAWIAVGFGLLFIVIPFRLFDTAFADIRVISAAAFILPAFVYLSLPRPGLRWIIGITASALAVANFTSVWFVWVTYRPEYAAMIASFEQIAKGSTILVAHSEDAQDPPFNLLEYPIYHASTLAVAYADALVPTLFTFPGKQPLTVRPAYRHLDIPQGSPVPVALLRAIASGRLAHPPAFIRSWTRDFDYLYVVGPLVSNPMPLLLHELASGSRFVLYKIDKSPETLERIRIR